MFGDFMPNIADIILSYQVFENAKIDKNLITISYVISNLLP